MQNDVNKTQLFYDYYQQWIEVYKKRCHQRRYNGEVFDDSEMG